MTGYSGTPLWQKLGLRPGMNAAAIGAPEGYHDHLLMGSPAVIWSDAGPGSDFVHVFSTHAGEVQVALATLRHQMRTGGMVWVSWPKKSAKVPTDITEDILRQIALPLGWVDVKVCAVDEVWSGLKFVIRKSLRCV